MNVESCYVSELFSFLTVISPGEVTRGLVTLTDTVLYDLQDGLKVAVHHASSVAARVVGCQIEMRLCDPAAPSHAISMTGGSCLVSAAGFRVYVLPTGNLTYPHRFRTA